MKISQFLVMLLLTLLGIRANSQTQLAVGSRLWHANRHAAIPTQFAPVNNANWRLDSMHCEVAADANNWAPQRNEYYSYDALGRLLETNTLAWDVEGAAWRPDTRAFTHYLGATTDVTETILLTWNAGLQAWGADTFRTRNDYEDGRIAEVLTETFDTLAGVWKADSREELIYDASGKISRRDGYLLADDGSGWSLFGQLIYDYIDDLPVTETFNVSLDGGTNWQPFYQATHIYQNKLLKETITQTIDFLTGTLVSNDRIVFTYDDRDLNVHADNYTWDGANWQPYGRCDLFYGDGAVLSTPDPAAASRELRLANPFSGGPVQLTGEQLTSDCELTVFDMHGAPVFKRTSADGCWQLPALPAGGVYVLTVREKGKVLAYRKIVGVQ